MDRHAVTHQSYIKLCCCCLFFKVHTEEYMENLHFNSQPTQNQPQKPTLTTDLFYIVQLNVNQPQTNPSAKLNAPAIHKPNDLLIRPLNTLIKKKKFKSKIMLKNYPKQPIS